MKYYEPQIDLFQLNTPRGDPAETTAYARRTDPDTSHAAAESIETTEMEALVLRTLVTFGDDGATTHEIAAALALSRDSVSPRMPPLVAKGYAIQTAMRRPGPSGRGCIVFKAA